MLYRQTEDRCLHLQPTVSLMGCASKIKEEKGGENNERLEEEREWHSDRHRHKF